MGKALCLVCWEVSNYGWIMQFDSFRFWFPFSLWVTFTPVFVKIRQWFYELEVWRWTQEQAFFIILLWSNLNFIWIWNWNSRGEAIYGSRKFLFGLCFPRSKWMIENFLKNWSKNEILKMNWFWINFKIIQKTWFWSTSQGLVLMNVWVERDTELKAVL